MKGREFSDWLKLLISLVICIGAGLIGSIFTTSSVSTWYPTINKPLFSPPNWLFAPVWSFLYILMGISVFLVWRLGLNHFQVKRGLILFTVQLILNILWSVAFFGLRSPFAGLIVIVLLLISILLTLLHFYNINRTSSFLLLPYILWVSFAMVLNLSIYLLNP
jgi:translocator protein